ncbi:MAG: hypothetical protein Q4G30_07595 [Actinomycetaceae bacterium]|nr:hypothetical protein [Actinomycetaceae bacterium]
MTDSPRIDPHLFDGMNRVQSPNNPGEDRLARRVARFFTRFFGPEGESKRMAVAFSAAIGVGTTVWYALPDYVSSRKGRTWIKSGLIFGLLASVGALAVRGLHQVYEASKPPLTTDSSIDSGHDAVDWQSVEDTSMEASGTTSLRSTTLVNSITSSSIGVSEGEHLFLDGECDCEDCDSEDSQPMPPAVFLPLLAGFIAASVAATVVIEKWLFRRGERRRLAGVKHAHLRQALPLGLLGALAAYIDPPTLEE